jgi:hypothetical protein
MTLHGSAQAVAQRMAYLQAMAIPIVARHYDGGPLVWECGCDRRDEGALYSNSFTSCARHARVLGDTEGRDQAAGEP